MVQADDKMTGVTAQPIDHANTDSADATIDIIVADAATYAVQLKRHT